MSYPPAPSGDPPAAESSRFSYGQRGDTASSRDKGMPGISCSRPPSGGTRHTRPVYVVYTDLFLDTFNYEHDWNTLWKDLIDTKVGTDRPPQVLLVLSQPLFDTVNRNENDTVSRDGRCFFTTPAAFDRIGNARYSAPTLFDTLVYFNVDPFASAKPAGGRSSLGTVSSLVSVVSTPFVSTFDRHMKCSAAVYIVFNTFFLRTESVQEYERSRELRIHFKSRLFPVHVYSREIVCRTACNFCSDAVLCMRHMDVYTVLPGKPMPSSRSLGPTVVKDLFRPERLVLLDVSADRGGRFAAAEYHRFKQFYCSFAHGRENKWGLRIATDGSLQAHVRAWNAMLREELRRWYWILVREAETSEGGSLRLKMQQVYAMCPCILTTADMDRVSCSGDCYAPSAVATRRPALKSLRNSYIQDTLMSKFDTSTFDVGCDVSDREYVSSLLAETVSVNNVFVIKCTRPDTTFRLEHNRFFSAFIDYPPDTWGS